MMAFESRASTVIYNLLKGFQRPGYFLLPANICPIVPLVFLKAGRAVKFVDISPITLCMDLDIAVEMVGRATKDIAGLLFVRTYGALLDLDIQLSTIKNLDNGIAILDDRCLCPPSNWEIPTGAADALLYSTGYGKFTDIGFGGFGLIKTHLTYFRSQLPYSAEALDAVTTSYKIAIQEEKPFVYGDSNWLESEPLGVTAEQYRSSVMQANDQSAEYKQRLNKIYRDVIPIECQLPERFQYWRFNVLVEEKNRLIEDIFGAGLFASSHYVPLTGIFADGSAPVATRLQKRVVNLFNDRYFDEDRAACVASIVAHHCRRTRSAYQGLAECVE